MGNGRVPAWRAEHGRGASATAAGARPEPPALPAAPGGGSPARCAGPAENVPRSSPFGGPNSARVAPSSRLPPFPFPFTLSVFHSRFPLLFPFFLSIHPFGFPFHFSPSIFLFHFPLSFFPFPFLHHSCRGPCSTVPCAAPRVSLSPPPRAKAIPHLPVAPLPGNGRQCPPWGREKGGDAGGTRGETRIWGDMRVRGS